MTRTLLKSKIHRATVTEANVDYVGSVTLDRRLMKAADLLPFEQVDVLNVTNGSRLTTYAIEDHSSRRGGVCLNGAAALLCSPGDIVLIVSYVQLDEKECEKHKPLIVQVHEKIKVKKIKRSEKPHALSRLRRG